MSYPSLEACLLDLEKAGHLVRIKEEVDPNLEMAAIHLRVYEMGGPAILFENVKGSKFRAVLFLKLPYLHIGVPPHPISNIDSFSITVNSSSHFFTTL
jgi:3-polyprenyl-4-hydroxybenzoate decarboxylase